MWKDGEDSIDVSVRRFSLSISFLLIFFFQVSLTSMAKIDLTRILLNL